MKNRYLLLLLPIIYACSIQASDYFICSTTHLYSSPNENSEKIGIFARGGFAKKIEFVDDIWWKVKADNQMIGYVKSKYLKSRLNSADKYEPDPDIFIQNDGYMGCPHLFVRAASLKARKEPNTSTKVDRVYLLTLPFA